MLNPITYTEQVVGDFLPRLDLRLGIILQLGVHHLVVRVLRLGKFREIPSPSTLTTGALVERILAHRAEFLKRQQAKFAREAVINADK